MIKGIKNQKTKRNLRYDEVLVVPIIENTPFEEDLKDRMAQVIEEYPETCAVLVRRHGVCMRFDSADCFGFKNVRMFVVVKKR